MTWSLSAVVKIAERTVRQRVRVCAEAPSAPRRARKPRMWFGAISFMRMGANSGRRYLRRVYS
ncbi:hypothetical protein GCM10027563_17780 [Parasphingorhabdus pacifica]